MKKLPKALKLGVLACCVSAQMVIPAYAEKEDKPVIRIAFPKAEHDSESIQNSGTIPSDYNYAYMEKLSEFTDWDLEYVFYDGDSPEEILGEETFASKAGSA